MTSWEKRKAEWSHTPSNLLYNNVDGEGNRLGFERAMRLCIAMVDGELLEWRGKQPDMVIDADGITQAIKDLEELGAAAKEALALYLTRGDDESGRDAVATAFGDSPIDWKQVIATTAFENEYSVLAV